MSILADWEIEELCTGEKPMISPFYPESKRYSEAGHRVPSYGNSSYGYDIQLSDKELKVFTDVHGGEIDIRNIDPDIYFVPKVKFAEDGAPYVILPPNGFLLGHTVEWFDMPKDVLGNCLGKSTYARGGMSVIVTPLEPEWEGNLVVEIVNNTTLPARVYLNCGIAQLTLLRGNPCRVTYKDRDGKYQGQKGTQDSIA